MFTLWIPSYRNSDLPSRPSVFIKIASPFLLMRNRLTSRLSPPSLKHEPISTSLSHTAHDQLWKPWFVFCPLAEEETSSLWQPVNIRSKAFSGCLSGISHQKSVTIDLDMWISIPQKALRLSSEKDNWHTLYAKTGLSYSPTHSSFVANDIYHTSINTT